jgi:hypothetical protein
MAIIEMTREEYEQKFGIKPDISSVENAITATKPKKDFLQKAEDVVSTVFPGKQVGRTLGTLAGKGITAGKEALGLVPKGTSAQYDATLPTGGQVAGDFISQAAMFTPGVGRGASFLAKLGAGTATGYAFDVGGKLQGTSKTVKEQFTPGIGTAFGATLPILGAVIGTTFSKAPQALEKTNLRMTPVEQQQMARQGKDIVEYMTQKKVVGSPQTRYAKVTQLYNDMENKVTNVVKQAGTTYNRDTLISEISQIPEQFANDIAGYDEAIKATDKIADFLKRKAPEEISGELLNTYKRGLFKRAYSKNNTDVLNESLHAVGSFLKEKLDNSIPALQALNKEYGNIILAKKILFKATTRAQTGLVGKLLGSAVGGTVGGTVGGGIGAGVGLIAGEQLSSKVLGTATRSTVGAGLQSVGELIAKLPVDKTGNIQIGKNTLIRLLQQISQ